MLATVGLIVGIVLIWQEQTRTRIAYLKADEQRRRADEQRRRADSNYKKALGAVNEMLTAMNAALLGHPDLAQHPQMAEVRLASLDRARRFYQELTEAKEDTPEARLEKAWAYLRLAQVLHWQAASGALLRERRPDLHTAAMHAIHTAIAMLERLAADFPNEPRFRYELAHSYIDLRHDTPNVPFTPAERDEANQAMNKAIAMLELLAADFPGEASYRQELADAYLRMGKALQARNLLNQTQEAEPLFRKARAAFEAVLARPQNLFNAQNGMISALHGLARSLDTPDRRHTLEVERTYCTALALRERWEAESHHEPRYLTPLIQDYFNFGAWLMKAGRLDEAEQIYRKGVARLEAVQVDPPPQLRPYDTLNLSRFHQVLGEMARQAGRLSEAEAEFRRSVAALEQAAAGDRSYLLQLARGEELLSDLLTNLGRHREAEVEYRKGLDTREALVKHQRTEVNGLGQAYETWASLQIGLGRTEEAEDAQRRALAIWESAVNEGSRSLQELSQLPRGPMFLIERIEHRNDLLLIVGRAEEAQKAYRETLELARQWVAQSPDQDRPRILLVESLFRLGVALKSAGSLEEAESILGQSAAEQKRLHDDFPKTRPPSTRYRWPSPGSPTRSRIRDVSGKPRR